MSSEKDAGDIISISWGLGTATKFALLDINRDKVPELIFTPDDGYHVDIVAYIKGKAKSVGSGFSGDQKYYQKVSKKKYQAYVKKLLSGAKDVKPKWHKNTAKNRKKYLR